MSKVEQKLEGMKENIKDYYYYFEDNFKRYSYFMNFVFNKSLSDADVDLLRALNRPEVEFNILEPVISRLMGEFADQEPNFEARQKDGGNPVPAQVLTTYEGYLRSILFDSNRDNMEYDIYADLLGGGFSAARVRTDYIGEKSFHQGIFINRVYNPTLTIFDKMARESHKGDGKMCCELYPMERTEFESKYGKKYTEKMKFTRNIGDFNWSYTTQSGKDIVLVGDYFEKQYKEAKIVQLIDGRVMTDEEYERNLAYWKNQTDVMMQVPGIVGKPRKTKFTTICRYNIVENDILKEEETDFKYLPIVFVDGNSKILQQTLRGGLYQMTRPYVYHAEGIQRLKNFAGISLANELESIIQSKIMAFKESIPAEYKDAWMNPQVASILVANAFRNDDPNVPLPMPQIIPRQPAPPEIAQTFITSDEMTRSILGNFDAVQGDINQKQLSGVAIANGAIQSNIASKPYLVGYMKAWQRIADICLDLIPKYITLPRSIPIVDKSGKRKYQDVNSPNSPSLEYGSDAIEIKVTAGVNFEIQRQQALDTLQGLMKTAPAFAQIIGNTPEGCEMILSNIDIRGVDALKQMVPQFFQQQAQMAQQQQQIQMQLNPMVIKKQENEIKSQKNQMEFEIEKARLNVEEQEADTDRILALNEIGDKADKNQLQQMKIQAEQARTVVDAMHKESIVKKDHANMQHSHAMDLLNLHHKNDQFYQNLNNQDNSSADTSVGDNK